VEPVNIVDGLPGAGVAVAADVEPMIERRADQEPVSQEEESKKEMKIPPELRLIPEPAAHTQDLFVPEKSWVWAEAVSAPEMVPEVPSLLETKASQVVNSGGFRISIVAAIVLALLISYIIGQNNRYSRALLVAPAAATTMESLVTPAKTLVTPAKAAVADKTDELKMGDKAGDKAPAAVQHRRMRSRHSHHRIR